MRCKWCGRKIVRRNRGGRRRDPVQQCPKAASFGLGDHRVCEAEQVYAPAVRTDLPRYNPDVARLARRRGPRKRYG